MPDSSHRRVLRLAQESDPSERLDESRNKAVRALEGWTPSPCGGVLPSPGLRPRGNPIFIRLAEEDVASLDRFRGGMLIRPGFNHSSEGHWMAPINRGGGREGIGVT